MGWTTDQCRRGKGVRERGQLATLNFGMSENVLSVEKFSSENAKMGLNAVRFVARVSFNAYSFSLVMRQKSFSVQLLGTF